MYVLVEDETVMTQGFVGKYEVSLYDVGQKVEDQTEYCVSISEAIIFGWEKAKRNKCNLLVRSLTPEGETEDEIYSYKKGAIK